MSGPKPRARDLGIPFEGTPGARNAITDVKGVCVGHKTRSDNHSINTGVTAILPLGNVVANNGPGIDTFVLAAWFALNGCGEMTGTTWIEESGFLEGPILLTNTVAVGKVRDAVIEYSIQQMGGKSRINPDNFGLYLPVVAETYDGWLNDILGFPVTEQDAQDALDGATPDNVEEGNVGGGTGMTCYSWKGGIGTSSRLAVGVLVQANQGNYWDLVIRGVPVGADPDFPKPPQSPDQPPRCHSRTARKSSIIVVIATDAPLLPHQLQRLARRAAHGVARTGTITDDDSGEIFIAFSTANPRAADDDKVVGVEMIPNDSMDPLFEATAQATEEAIINALIAARTLTGRGGKNTATAITDVSNPSLVDVMKKYNRWKPPPKSSRQRPPKTSRKRPRTP
jgi:L-aminopeptidase/D-esterase-like protein